MRRKEEVGKCRLGKCLGKGSAFKENKYGESRRNMRPRVKSVDKMIGSFSEEVQQEIDTKSKKRRKGEEGCQETS